MALGSGSFMHLGTKPDAPLRRLKNLGERQSKALSLAQTGQEPSEDCPLEAAERLVGGRGLQWGSGESMKPPPAPRSCKPTLRRPPRKGREASPRVSAQPGAQRSEHGPGDSAPRADTQRMKWTPAGRTRPHVGNTRPRTTHESQTSSSRVSSHAPSSSQKL